MAGVWIWPLRALPVPPFASHMAMHMAVVALAAPLIAAGIAGGPLDPVRRWPALMSPIPASFVELALVWGWHAPALHHAARDSASVLALEQGSFLLAGLWLWCSALGGAPAVRRSRATAGVAAMLLTSMHMTLLGALIALPDRVLFAHAHGCDPALSPLHDQQLGGAIMLLTGGAAYLAGGLYLTADALREPEGERA